jgi:hypothetical protein
MERLEPRAAAAAAGYRGRPCRRGGEAMKFAKSFASLLVVWNAGAAVGQALADPPPFTGAHTTDVHGAIQPPMAIDLPAESSATGGLACGPCASCGAFRYIDVEFVSLKQNSPSHKELLIVLGQSDNNGPPFVADEYRTGTVNTHFAPGVKVKFGRWLCDDLAVEAGFFVLDEFFYKREYLAITSSGGTFGGSTSLTVTFAPTNTSLDWTKIYNVVEHWGLETNLRRKFVDNCRISATGVLGLRYHQIHERFNIDFAPVRATGFNESFDSGNDIVGLQFGAQTDWKMNRFVAVRGKAAYVFGLNFQWDSIKGPAPGSGALTGANNLGYHDDIRLGNFADLSLGVAAQLTPCIETSIGFAYLAFGGVRRSANLLDLQNIGNPELKGGQDWLSLYGLTISCKVDF